LEKRQALRLTWRTSGGKTFSMTIRNPNDDVTPEEIESFMNMVIQKNIVNSSSGDLVQALDAHLINTEDYDLYTPA